MPVFELNQGDCQAQFKALDDFTQGYVEAAFYCGIEAMPADRLSLDLLAIETWERIKDECEAFQIGNEAALATACETTSKHGRKLRYDMTHAGRDFWLTRNDHGAGFWDGDLPDDVGEELTAAARDAGERDLYMGDDHKLYLYPPPKD